MAVIGYFAYKGGHQGLAFSLWSFGSFVAGLSLILQSGMRLYGVLALAAGVTLAVLAGFLPAQVADDAKLLAGAFAFLAAIVWGFKQIVFSWKEKPNG